MTSPTAEVLATSMQTTDEWLRDVMYRYGTDDAHEAYRILRSTLQGLRDAVGYEIAAHLSAQLPLVLRGAFYEGWDPTPARTDKHQEFLDRLDRDLALSSGEAVRAARVALGVIADRLSEGTLDKATSALPRSLTDELGLHRRS